MKENTIKIHRTDENLLLAKEFLLFLKSDKGNSSNTIKSYEIDLKHFLNIFKMKEILLLKENDIREYKYQLVNQGLKPRTINRKLAVIRGFYDYFVYHDNYDIYKSPAKNVRNSKVPISIPVVLSKSQSKLLLDGILLLGRYALRDYAIFSTLLFSAVRISELIKLNVVDLDFDNKTITIRGGKGNKDRIIPMLARLERALLKYLNAGVSYEVETVKLKTKDKKIQYINKAYCGRKYFIKGEDPGFLFLTKDGKPFTAKGVEYHLKSYLNKLGIQDKKFSLHALRRSGLTFLYEIPEMDLFKLRQISGHKNIQTLEHYLNIDNQKIAEAMKHHPLADMDMDMKIVELFQNRK